MKQGLLGICAALVEQGELTGDNADTFKKLQSEYISVLDKMEALKNKGKENTKAYKALDKQATALFKSMGELSAEMGVQVVETQGLQGAMQLLSDEVGGSQYQMVKCLVLLMLLM